MSTTATKANYLFLDFPNQQLDEEDLMILVYNITGNLYSFASATDMQWGPDGEKLNFGTPGYEEGFFQLMPVRTDDGFFDWYCEKREEYQFFKSKEDCTLHFINYWFHWKYADQGEFITKNTRHA